MESREVKITFEQAKEMFESGNNIFKELALKTFPELRNFQFPKSWEELCELKNNEKGFYLGSCGDIFESKFKKSSDAINTISTKERAEKILLLQQLLEIRDYWNEIDKYIIDWASSKQIKYCIVKYNNKISIESRYSSNDMFAFKTKERTNQFINIFEKELLQVLSI